MKLYFLLSLIALVLFTSCNKEIDKPKTTHELIQGEWLGSKMELRLDNQVLSEHTFTDVWIFNEYDITDVTNNYTGPYHIVNHNTVNINGSKFTIAQLNNKYFVIEKPHELAGTNLPPGTINRYYFIK